MYTPRHFAEPDESGYATIRAHPFALLVTWDAGEPAPPATTHAPLILDPEAAKPTLLGHVARANPHAAALAEARPALAIFSGPDAYVSPNWYATKQAGGQAVPTWNYVAAHVTGTIRPLPDLEDKRRCVRLLSRAMEGDGPGAWRLDDEPEDYVRRMLGGITAFALEIATVEAKAKLSQNRPAEDRASVIAGLAAAGRPAERAVADAMRARGADA